MTTRSFLNAGRVAICDPRSFLESARALLLGPLLALSIGSAGAAVRFSEGFETYTTGSNIHGQAAGTSTWSVAGTVAGDQAVISTTTAAAGTKSLFLADNGSGRPRASLNLVTAGFIPTALTKGVFTFSLREDPGDGGAGDSFTVNLGNMSISHSAGTSSFYFSITGGGGKTVAYTPGAWTKISVAFDDTTKTASISVNDVSAGSITGAAADFTLSSFTLGTYSSGETGSAIYFDAIEVDDLAGAYASSKIRNGSFSDATSPWKLGLKNSAVATLVASGGWGTIDIQSLAASPVHNANVTLEQNLTGNLTAGTAHTISFTAKADTSKTIDAFLYDANNTIVWQQWSIPVTTTAANYSYSYTPAATITSPKLVIRVGATNVDISFDNVSVNRGTTPLIANGGFGGVAGPWTLALQNSATGTLSVDANAGRVDIQSLPSPAKANVAVRQKLDDFLFKNVPYTLAFTARADAPKSIDAILYDAGNTIIWAQYGIAVGTSSTNYTFTCTPPANCDGASLVFQVGGENAGITFDNVSLSGLELLTWAPPSLVNPVTINLGTSDPVPLLSSGTDYIIKLPSTTRISTVKIQGGRNVVVIGGHVQITAAGGTAFYIRGGNLGRTVHVEGVYIDSDTLAEGDAFAIDGSLQGTQAPDMIVQIQNVRVERLYGTMSTLHADIIQPWGGVKELRVDR